MTLDDFRKSLTATGLTLAVAGLWWDAKGDWPRAHESAQQDEGTEGSWVHAVSREPLVAEWLSIVTALLG